MSSPSRAPARRRRAPRVLRTAPLPVGIAHTRPQDTHGAARGLAVVRVRGSSTASMKPANATKVSNVDCGGGGGRESCAEVQECRVCVCERQRARRGAADGADNGADAVPRARSYGDDEPTRARGSAVPRRTWVYAGRAHTIDAVVAPPSLCGACPPRPPPPPADSARRTSPASSRQLPPRCRHVHGTCPQRSKGSRTSADAVRRKVP